eukprot:6366968-Prymnesium_polylepis.1
MGNVACAPSNATRSHPAQDALDEHHGAAADSQLADNGPHSAGAPFSREPAAAEALHGVGRHCAPCNPNAGKVLYAPSCAPSATQRACCGELARTRLHERHGSRGTIGVGTAGGRVYHGLRQLSAIPHKLDLALAHPVAFFHKAQSFQHR